MRLVLTGAYGYTAQLIAQRLHAENIRYSIAGRDEAKLLDLKSRFDSIEKVIGLDLRNPQQVKQFIQQFDIFLNCAGPFTEESEILLQELSAAQNKVYVDITGESEFVRGSYEKYGKAAEQHNTLIIHANAFESLLAELAVQIAGPEKGRLKSCYTYYWFAPAKPSPGTRMTMKLSKHRLFHRLTGGEWVVLDPSGSHQSVRHRGEEMTAVPYPLPEMVFFRQNLACENALSYLIVNRDAARFIGDKTNDQGSARDELDRLKQQKFTGPTEAQRASQHFELVTKLLTQDDQETTVTLSGTDMYDLTAQLIVETTRRILEGTSRYGVISPGIIHAGLAKEMLKRMNISVTVTNGP